MSEPAKLLPWLAAPLQKGLGLPAHALLLHGPGGVGQFELGQALASAWLCEAGAGRAPACGVCPACHLMAAQVHPDFLLLVPEALRDGLGWGQGGDAAEEGAKAGKAKPSQEIRVKEVRAAIAWSQQTSSRGLAKVLLIHPAPAMNAVTANALLKTLEEPPGRLRLLLTAHDPQALLPTVRSRCQLLALPLPPPAAALGWLAAQGLDRPEVLLAAAGGQPLQAQAMAAEGLSAQAWEELPRSVCSARAAPLAQWPLVRLVDALQKLCHDLMACRAGGAPRYFAAPLLAPLLPPGAPDLSALAAWSSDLMQAARHAGHPWHAGLRVEALVGQGARLWQTPRNGARLSARPVDTLHGP